MGIGKATWSTYTLNTSWSRVLAHRCIIKVMAHCWEPRDLGPFRSCHCLPGDLGQVTGSGLPLNSSVQCWFRAPVPHGHSHKVLSFFESILEGSFLFPFAPPIAVAKCSRSVSLTGQSSARRTGKSSSNTQGRGLALLPLCATVSASSWCVLVEVCTSGCRRLQ